MASRIATSIRLAVVNHIPSCRELCGGVLTMVKYNSDPLICIGCPINQGWMLRLGHILGLAHNRKLTFEEGDLPSCRTGLPTSRSQQDDILLSCLLSPADSSVRHDSGRPRLGHLLPKLGHVIGVPG
jgi:hypothetical protein